ncbi:MAG: hypothetical protein ABI083_08255 [Lapillicoccus sp.]
MTVTDSRAALTALAVAAALHLGFQATVTALVYPALARVPASEWSSAHAAHSRRIVPLVAITYAALLATGLWALLTAPVGALLIVSLGGATVSLITTAAAAAPLHGRLGAGPTLGLLTRLLWVDRLRAAGAVVCFVGALGALA